MLTGEWQLGVLYAVVLGANLLVTYWLVRLGAGGRQTVPPGSVPTPTPESAGDVESDSRTDPPVVPDDGEERPDSTSASRGETAVVDCPTCGVENERGYRYCRNCVSTLPGAADTGGSSVVGLGRTIR